MGVFVATVIDTTPGACVESPWSPPADWQGDNDDYKSLMRQRWHDMLWGQRMRFCIRMAKDVPVSCRGEHARIAGDILEALMNQTGVRPRLNFSQEDVTSED